MTRNIGNFELSPSEYHKIVFAAFKWTDAQSKKNPLMTRAVMTARRSVFKALLELPETKFATADDAQAVWSKLTPLQKKWSYVSSIRAIYGVL